MAVEAHTHVSPVHFIAIALFIFAVFGTLHLLSLSSESRWSRAYIATGF